MANNGVIRKLHPDVVVVDADLAESGDWGKHLDGAEAVVMLQAQIGGLVYSEFVHNTLMSSERVLAAAKRYEVPYVLHISSSVVSSRADDFNCRSKRAQEEMVVKAGFKCAILRPTLMFGWFDRKHLGWLARFMARMPVFPIPGNGRYIRQALFELDFCGIILVCLEKKSKALTISAALAVHYIDLIRQLKEATGAKTLIVKIPYSLFWLILKAYPLFDHHPPFTTQQLRRL